MMCARILKHVPEEKQGKFYHASQVYFDRIIASYGKSLQWVLKRQTATLVVAVATFVAIWQNASAGVRMLIACQLRLSTSTIVLFSMSVIKSVSCGGWRVT